MNIVTLKLQEYNRTHGKLEDNLVGLSAIAAPVMKLMSDEDILVRQLGKSNMLGIAGSFGRA